MKSIHYRNIHIVEDEEEAEQFRYEHNNETVAIGTPVGYDELVDNIPTEMTHVPWADKSLCIKFRLFSGIYYCPDMSEE